MLTLVVLAATAQVALAGPPLLCHPFEIGTAKSLTWDNSHGWQGRVGAANMKTLVADTESLLTPDTPVIVRMETIRRAAIYASADAAVARELFTRLQARAAGAKPGALETFDAGYLIETFRQIGDMERWKRDDGSPIQYAALRSLVGSADGAAMIQQTLAARSGEPAIEFAAALIAASHKGGSRNADYLKHAQKARAGAAQDPLLAKNLDHISGT
jgi:hypothetical protein